MVDKIGSEGPTVLDVIQKGEAQLVINTLTKGKQPERDGFRIRRESVENGVPCFTSLDTAEAMLTCYRINDIPSGEWKCTRVGRTCYDHSRMRMKVVSNSKLPESIFEMTLAGNLVGEMNPPGQFVHIRVSGFV